MSLFVSDCCLFGKLDEVIPRCLISRLLNGLLILNPANLLAMTLRRSPWSLTGMWFIRSFIVGCSPLRWRVLIGRCGEIPNGISRDELDSDAGSPLMNHKVVLSPSGRA